MIREGLFPGISISDNPPRIEDEQAPSIPELVQQEVGKHMEEFGYEPSEAPEVPDEQADPLEDDRGSGDPAEDPGGEEVEMIEVIDPKTGETVMIPKTDSSYYSASGYKTRKYKGSSKPPDVPSFLWKAASKAEREKEIKRWEREEARRKLLAEKSKHKAAVAQADGILRHQKSGAVPVELEQDAAWEGVPTMPTREPAKHPHREKGILQYQWLNALVARPVGQKEIRDTPDAQRSLDVEWVKLESKPAWLYDKVQEWQHVSEEAVRTGTKIHVGKVFELCVEKGSELPKGSPLRKYKGRTVFQGNDVKDESDMVALFSELGSAPSNMEAGKALDCFGSAPGNKITQGDGKQAYTQTTLKGKPTWIRVPRNRWPKEWHGKYKDPVIPLVLALYGHPDSGGFWERHCEECLGKVGFRAVHPECWPSIFWHAELSLLLAVYVDDFKLAGPASNHEKGWQLIGTHIDMDTPEDVGRYLGCDHIVSHNVKLPVDVHPFAHVFDHELSDPASKPAAPVRRTQDYWTHFPERGTFVHHHVQPRRRFEIRPVSAVGLDPCDLRYTEYVPCTEGSDAKNAGGASHIWHDIKVDRQQGLPFWWTGETYFIDKCIPDPKVAVAAVKRIRDKTKAKKAARAQGFTFLDQLEEQQGCMTKPVTTVKYDMRGFLRQCLERYESLVKKPVTYRKVSTPFHDDKIASKTYRG